MSVLANTTNHPMGLDVDRAEGIWIYTTDGKRYMDMISGIGVSALGHGHPTIKEAIKAQVDKHLHVMVYGEFNQAASQSAGQKLIDLLPENLDSVYFTNSGAEANEAALKLAKRVTGRSKIVSFNGAYHGSTHGALSVTGNEVKKSAFRPLLPDIHFITLDDPKGLQVIDGQCAAVILETIQGDAGMRVPSVKYMRALRQKCDDTGTLLILDEIQCGLGRTGKMFAFEHFEIEPDILTLGKALGGGMPIGAMCASQSSMDLFTHDPELGHITTFGGHPLSCAAAGAFIDVLTGADETSTALSLTRIQQHGEHIKARLARGEGVIEIRQIGLFFAIDMGTPDRVQKVVEGCLERGLISFWFLSCPTAFRIAPPYTMTQEEIDAACDIILAAMENTASQ